MTSINEPGEDVYDSGYGRMMRGVQLEGCTCTLTRQRTFDEPAEWDFDPDCPIHAIGTFTPDDRSNPLVRCECTWRTHEGVPCPNPPAEHDNGIVVSPALCMSCLFVCEGERDDEADCIHGLIFEDRDSVHFSTLWRCGDCGKTWSVTDVELVAHGLPPDLARVQARFEKAMQIAAEEEG